MSGGRECYTAHLPTPSKHKVDTQWCNSIMKMKRTHRFAKNKSPQNVKCITNGHIRGPRCDLFSFQTHIHQKNNHNPKVMITFMCIKPGIICYMSYSVHNDLGEFEVYELGSHKQFPFLFMAM